MGRLVAGVLLLLAAACASPGPPDEPPVTPASPASAQCPTGVTLDRPPTEPLPADFTAASVFRCGDELRAVPGDGKWWFRVRQQADTDAAALLTALRRPDEESPAEVACPGIAITAPWFALVDGAGRVVHPRVPLDRCRQPQRQALDAMTALHFREVTATRMRQEETQKAIDTGCGMLGTRAPDYDVLGSDEPGPARRLWARPPQAIKICLWRTRGGQIELVSAGTVTGSTMTALVARLETLPAARRCSGIPRSWATLEYVRKGWYDDGLLVELDGCRRFSRPDHTLGLVDAATARLVRALVH